MGKMCGRTCVGVTSGKKARTHALRTHVLEVISHAPANVRPHIARVRARTHLRNPYLANICSSIFHVRHLLLDLNPTTVFLRLTDRADSGCADTDSLFQVKDVGLPK